MINIIRRRLLVCAGALLAATFHFSPSMAQDKTLKIAVSVPSLSFPWYVHMQNQFLDEAKKLGVDVVVMDGENSAPKQTSDVEAAVVQKVDAIVIAPIDVNALSPALEQAIGQSIPVVTFDRTASGVEGILGHVGADNAKGGEAQARQIMADFPNGAKIFNLQGQPGAGPAIERNKGLHAVLDAVKEKYPIIFEQTANFARAEALTVTETGLTQATPDVIVAANDDMALGAVEALKARNLSSVAVYGFDALPEALKAIQSGAMRATIEQGPGEQARQSLRVAVDFLKNQKKPENANNLLTPFAVTKDNLDKAERIGEAK